MKYQAVLIFTLVLCISQGESRMLCGGRLPEIVAYLCANPLTSREDFASFQMKRAETSYNSITNAVDWPWIPHHEAKGIRNKRRIIDECCKKSCTVDELMEYC
ncbi:insulin-related peptide 1-like [Pieris napi]|uniref:insulin-related peptide 1-like n=1 Tax=Pieris napi TaxID=78633 RepID=UPI001FB9C757|nr:insulin-related peptide 1-like [Pieris napi]